MVWWFQTTTILAREATDPRDSITWKSDCSLLYVSMTAVNPWAAGGEEGRARGLEGGGGSAEVGERRRSRRCRVERASEEGEEKWRVWAVRQAARREETVEEGRARRWGRREEAAREGRMVMEREDQSTRGERGRENEEEEEEAI